ncbi:MAG TPA: hypothetical protein VHB21_13645 [Minicystis sp.]|nr:hypothetical protein [Minicystis sp.]
MTWFGTGAIALSAAVAACSGGGSGDSGTFGTGGSAGAGSGTNAGGSGGGLHQMLAQSIAIEPPSAAIESLNGAPATQKFKAKVRWQDGSLAEVSSGVNWSVDVLQPGAIDGQGLYTANGSVGGVVKIGAAFGGKSATATLTVKLHLTQNAAMADPSVQGALEGASQQDASIVWAYPYDGTVWPRGLLAPLLQWNGGAPTDVYLVKLANSTFELESFVTAPGAPTAQVPFDATTWQEFVDSSAGKTKFTVARWDGQNATVVASHTWTIAPASMRGTIYYWSNDLGRVLRIKPGASMPDDFANQAPLNDPNQYTQSSCLMTCHTVSADGSTLVSGGGVFGGSYDLHTGQPTVSLGGTWGGPNGSSSSVVKWSNAAVSPTGKYILTNAMAEALAYANDGATTGFLGLYTTADGMPVPSSGLMGLPLTQPAWSPEGSRIAFVDAGDPVGGPAPWAGSWNVPPPGDLKVYAFDESQSPMVSGPTTLVATGADPNQRIAWPSVTPDGKWVAYQRGAGADTRSGHADLYFASAVTPNQEARLASVDGDGYPFAAGPRDLAYNYEPSFAPVAAGGYFWVVFTSRRTYGNVLTGDPTVVKQLWVAAIDENPQPGVDPSHPAFHLTGQDEQNLAMRGFWALDPCKSDGSSCMSGTECCGGFCDGDVCKSKSDGCSKAGDHCDTTSDCCSASAGVMCINHVCSEAPPH